MNLLRDILLSQKIEQHRGVNFVDAVSKENVFKSYSQIYRESEVVQKNLSSFYKDDLEEKLKNTGLEFFN